MFRAFFSLNGWLVFASILFATLPARAEPALTMDDVLGKSQDWTIGFSRGLDGCLARAAYSDNTSVWLGFSSKFGFYFAVINPAWRSVEAGKTYPIKIETHGHGTWKGNFMGFQGDPDRGIISVGLKKEFLYDLAAANGVSVQLGEKSIARVSMSGSRAALTETLTCQQARGFHQTEAKAPVPRQSEKRGGSGTGFFVSDQGHVITNAHVVEGCEQLSVSPVNTLGGDAKLLAVDKRNDLALLQTSLKPKAVPAMRMRARVGENIAVFGFPLSSLLTATGNFTLGNITANAGMKDDSSQLQISAPVQPGNSGGPLIDQNGNIVGVIVAKLNAMAVAQAVQDVPQNVNFAIKAATAVNFLETNGVSPPTAESQSTLTNADLAELAKSFTVRVICK